LHFENQFFDPVAYLCNQSETIWLGTTQGSFLLSLVNFPLEVQEKIFEKCDETRFSTIEPSIDVKGIRNGRWQ